MGRWVDWGGLPGWGRVVNRFGQQEKRPKGIAGVAGMSPRARSVGKPGEANGHGEGRAGDHPDKVDGVERGRIRWSREYSRLVAG